MTMSSPWRIPSWPIVHSPRSSISSKRSVKELRGECPLSQKAMMINVLTLSMLSLSFTCQVRRSGGGPGFPWGPGPQGGSPEPQGARPGAPGGPLGTPGGPRTDWIDLMMYLLMMYLMMMPDVTVMTVMRVMRGSISGTCILHPQSMFEVGPGGPRGPPEVGGP